MFICVLPVMAIGAETPTGLPEGFMQVFQWALGLALLANGFFIKRALDKLDRHSDAITAIGSRLSHLEGEHQATHGRE